MSKRLRVVFGQNLGLFLEKICLVLFVQMPWKQNMPFASILNWKKSFQDLDEEDKCSTSLCESFIDSESDEVFILYQAAVILRQRISKTEGLQQEYYSANGFSFEAHRDFWTPFFSVSWTGCLAKQS